MNIQEAMDFVKNRMEAGETFYDIFPPVQQERRSAWVEPSLIPLAFVLGAFAMIAGGIKVKNELEMTKQYARWADASVRQAEALERAYPVPPTISEQIAQMEFELWLDKFMRKNHLPAKVKEVRLR